MRKNNFVLVIFLFLGMITGGIIAELLEPVSALSFLTKSVHVTWEPKADFQIFKYDFFIQVKLNLLNILGLITALWIYRQI